MSTNLDIILEVVENARSSFFKVTKTSLVIGRDADKADIVLSESGASKEHCRIDFKAGLGFTVTDLNSKNGTHINNLPVKKSSFFLDDVIQIGESYIRFASSQMSVNACMKLKNPNKLKKMNKSITLVQGSTTKDRLVSNDGDHHGMKEITAIDDMNRIRGAGKLIERNNPSKKKKKKS